MFAEINSKNQLALSEGEDSWNIPNIFFYWTGTMLEFEIATFYLLIMIIV